MSNMNISSAYAILGLAFNSPFQLVRKAFAKLANSTHPDKNGDQGNEKFMEIQLAYECIKKSDKNSSGGSSKDERQPPPNEFPLHLTLEEIFHGCSKDLPIVRKVVNKKGTEKTEDAVVKVDVEAGTLTGTRITVEKSGDSYHGRPPANVVFTLHEVPHDIFKRSRFDLEYTAKISTKQASGFGEVMIPTMDGAMERLAINEHITQRTIKTIPNRGFPYPGLAKKGLPEKRGDLLVRFEIQYETNKPKGPPQDPPIEHDLFLTLKQILEGCKKNVKIQRLLVEPDGSETEEDAKLTIDVVPGTVDGTRHTFPKAGDRKPDVLPADIVFIVRDKEAEYFQRNGADVVYTYPVKASEAEVGCSFEFTSFDGAKLKVLTPKKITTKTTELFESYGLPFSPDESGKQGQHAEQFEFIDDQDQVAGSLPDCKGDTKRGNLLVKFDIIDDYKIAPPIERELFITLEQVLHGGQVSLNYNRIWENELGNKIEEADKCLCVDIKPGAWPRSKMVFPRLGDHYRGKIPGDLVVVIRDKKHDTFVRDDVNIKYAAKLTLRRYKEGEGDISIPTLDGGERQVALRDIINPTCFTIKELGLPFEGMPNKRGNLIVSLDFIEDLQDETVQYEVYLLPEELINGCSLERTIELKVLDQNGNQRTESKKFLLNIEPGTKAGKRIAFPKAGIQNAGRIPADIEFVLMIKTQDPRVEQPLKVSLEEILHGSNKKVKIKTNVIKSNGDESVEENILTIDVKPGTKAGEEFVFEKAGDQYEDSIPADIVFIVRDKPHDHFARNGADIEYVMDITAKQSSCGLEAEIPTLEKEYLTFKFSAEEIASGTKRIANRGLPYPNEPNKRGDLVVKFHVVD